VREAAQRAAASAAAPPSAVAGKRADPVEKIKRETTANVAKVKGESEQVLKALTDERDRVAPELAFAQVLPTTALRLLAETLASGDEPALSAAKRKVMSGDFEGARADLRRYAEGPGANNAAAWRNLGTLECMSDLKRAVEALERAHELDPRQFVTLVSLRRLYSGSGRLNEGRDAATAAIPLAADDREQAIALDELGEACMFLKDIPAAAQAFERSLSIVKTLAEREPRNVEFRRDLAIGHFKLARLGGDDGREHLAQSIAAFEKMKASGALAPEDQVALKQLKEALVDYDKKG
jgi:tetratricopeptide (TPR) repeat protein